MFSDLNRNNYERARADSRDNVMDIIGRAGVSLSWIDNDGGDKGISKNFQLQEINHSVYPELCRDGVCYDEVMLRELDQQIQSSQDTNLSLCISLVAMVQLITNAIQKIKHIFSPIVLVVILKIVVMKKSSIPTTTRLLIPTLCWLNLSKSSTTTKKTTMWP